MAVHYSQQQQQQLFQMAASSLAGCGGVGGNQASLAALFPQTLVSPPPPVFSEPVSELTCNVSGSRKRAREEEAVMPLLPTMSSVLLYQQQQQQLLLSNAAAQMMQRTKATQPQQALASYVDLVTADSSSRLNQSMMTSTSGRVTTESPPTALPNIISNTCTTAAAGISPPSSGLISMLHYQSMEVDALVRLHTEKLRSALDEARKRQCRAVITALGQQAQRRISEKQAELDVATKRNAELEERLRQAASESQAWFNVARNSEALVSSLRASLEQALLQKYSHDGNNVIIEVDEDDDDDQGNNRVAAVVDLEEGYGDSEEEAVSAAAAGASAAAVSCSVRVPAGSAAGGVSRKLPASAGGLGCRSCGSSDACVLVLPCRHLCLCRSCESSVDECPICRTRKNGSLQVNLC